jgi:hypothetical protein
MAFIPTIFSYGVYVAPGLLSPSLDESDIFDPPFSQKFL